MNLVNPVNPVEFVFDRESDRPASPVTSFGKYLDWIKLSPKYLSPIALVSGFLLFAKPSWLARFGLVEFVAQYRPYIGVIFLLAASLLVSHWLISSYKWLAKRRLWSKELKSAKQHLHNLTHEEREILRAYVGRDTRTQYLPIESGVVAGLEWQHIILRSSHIGSLVDGWAYNIQPWAWDYLHEHPELLFSKEELEQLDALNQQEL